MAASTRRPGILIVEDVEEMLQLLDHVVQEMKGFQVAGLARNVAEARVVLLRRRPALVLLDEVLPGESALDLLEELRSEGIPVFLITSMAERTAPLPPGTLGRLYKPSWKSADSDRARIEAALASGMTQWVKSG